mmetsp:Transcript_51001/g.128702  ORF Transcript_51001/g.128702 Transcript_51001/m.128702 type:complete len:234 (+) Transcript_51001:73-774(+)
MQTSQLGKNPAVKRVLSTRALRPKTACNPSSVESGGRGYGERCWLSCIAANLPSYKNKNSSPIASARQEKALPQSLPIDLLRTNHCSQPRARLRQSFPRACVSRRHSEVLCMHHEAGPVVRLVRFSRVSGGALQLAAQGLWSTKENANVLPRMLLRKLRHNLLPIWPAHELLKAIAQHPHLRELNHGGLEQVDLNSVPGRPLQRFREQLVEPMELVLPAAQPIKVHLLTRLPC